MFITTIQTFISKLTNRINLIWESERGNENQSVYGKGKWPESLLHCFIFLDNVSCQAVAFLLANGSQWLWSNLICFVLFVGWITKQTYLSKYPLKCLAILLKKNGEHGKLIVGGITIWIRRNRRWCGLVWRSIEPDARHWCTCVICRPARSIGHHAAQLHLCTQCHLDRVC